MCVAFACLTLLAGNPVSRALAAPLSMIQAERMALANAYSLRVAGLESLAAVRAYRAGIRDLLPTLSLGVEDSRSVLRNAPDTASHTWSLTMAQPVFDGGRLLRRRGLAALQIALDEADYAVQEDSLLDGVRGMFNRVLVQKEKLSIQWDVHAAMQEQVAVARTEREIGAALEVDLLDAELELSSVDLEMRAAQTLLEDYEFRLKRLLGMEPQDVVELDGELDRLYAGTPLPPDRAYFMEIAERNNPGLKHQDLEVLKSLEELRVADSWYLPDVGLEVSLSVSGDRYPLQTPGLSGKLIVSFPFRPFPLSASVSLGGTPGAERDAGSTASVGVLSDVRFWTDRSTRLLACEASRLKRSDMGQDLESEVSNALSAYEQARRALELRRRNVELQERKVFIMSRQLALGGFKRIDYLQAQTRLARDRSGLVEQVLELMESERSFERLLGLRSGELARVIKGYSGGGSR
jgi:outer membrane protein TolC